MTQSHSGALNWGFSAHTWKDEDEMTHHHRRLRCNHFPPGRCAGPWRRRWAQCRAGPCWGRRMCAASGAACQGRAFIAALSPQRRGLQPHLGTGNVNMPTRGKAGGSGQEAKAKSCSAFAVKQLPGLSTFWSRPASSSGQTWERRQGQCWLLTPGGIPGGGFPKGTV